MESDQQRDGTNPVPRHTVTKKNGVEEGTEGNKSDSVPFLSLLLPYSGHLAPGVFRCTPLGWTQSQYMLMELPPPLQGEKQELSCVFLNLSLVGILRPMTSKQPFYSSLGMCLRLLSCVSSCMQ